jgi:hypothetical protein
MRHEPASEELHDCLEKLHEVQVTLDRHDLPAAITANLDLAISKLRELLNSGP